MRVLVIPNYTNFGMAKDINRYSFLLVFKSFLDNTQIGKEWEWILPYPDLNNHPGIINLNIQMSSWLKWMDWIAFHQK